MMKKILLYIICLFAVSASAQTKLNGTAMTNRMATSSNNYVSIHDPSVVYDAANRKFWIVGSHIGVASSTDLVNWSGYNTGYEHSVFFNKGYGTAFSSCPSHEVNVKRGGNIVTATLNSCDAGAFASIYAQGTAKEWISGDMWAPDIIYNPNMGKWCLYLSVNGDHWASVIILLTSDKPQGPYTYQAPIVFGGFNGVAYGGKKVSIANTDMAVVTGSNAVPTRFTQAGNSWGTYYPNCIDPCVFFDEDGELWMAYGSWSGGIWMLKLDKDTGLRDYTCTYSGTTLNADATSDQYYGKKIAGGYYVSGEGSYIKHIGDYYYLFMTYGGLAPDGGYEMRVFRSTSPTGPYKDGTSGSAIYNGYSLNFGAKATTNRGMKIIGAMNGWGNMTVGECAQGHNSAVLDADGNAYVVFHTKFNDGTQGHQIRLHRIFVNEKGWLVTSPFRYMGTKNAKTGEPTTTQKMIDSQQLFTPEELAGTYRIMTHPYRLDHDAYAETTPSEVRLTAGGTVSGAYSGTWKYSNDSTSYVTLNVGGAIYYGVAEKQMINGNSLDAVCLTAVSASGVPLWMYKYDDASALAVNYKSIYTDYFSKSSASSPLKTSVPATTDDVVALYESPDVSVLSPQGVFTPVASSSAYTRIGSLTGTLSKGDCYVTFSRVATYYANNTAGADIADGIVAHYALDATDNVNDVEGEQQMSVGRGSASGKVPVVYADGSRGNVLYQYSGSQANASYAVMPNPLNGTGAEAFTVCMWVKPVKRTDWDCIFSFFDGNKPADSGGRFYFTDNTYCGYNDAEGNYFDINYPDKKVSTLANLKWSFVTVVMTGEGYTLYVDGVARKQSSYAGSATVSAFDYASAISKICSYRNMCLGMGSFWGSSNVMLSDLTVYSRGLDADDVSLLYGCSLNPAANQSASGVDETVADRIAIPSAALYNVSGQRVASGYKGIVISNGKKYIQK